MHQEHDLRGKNSSEPSPKKMKIVIFGHFGLTEGPRYQRIAHAKKRLADEALNANVRRAQQLRTDEVPFAMGAKP
jgi:hypothetical protein